MSTVQIVVVVLVVIVVVVIGLVAWMAARRRSLRQRFGPEYDRVVSEQDNRLAAERELRARERRHAELELRPLSPQSRARYATAWEEVQARFVDEPNDAVKAGDALVTRLVAERGYPTENFDDQLAHLSVEHARTLEHYRDAHDINVRNERGEASTEQLRQALVHYRALFSDLLGDSPDGHGTRTERAETERAETERAETERAETERAETERAETERAETERAETERAETERAEYDPARTESAADPRTEPTATVPPTAEGSSDARPEPTP